MTRQALSILSALLLFVLAGQARNTGVIPAPQRVSYGKGTCSLAATGGIDAVRSSVSKKLDPEEYEIRITPKGIKRHGQWNDMEAVYSFPDRDQGRLHDMAAPLRPRRSRLEPARSEGLRRFPRQDGTGIPLPGQPRGPLLRPPQPVPNPGTATTRKIQPLTCHTVFKSHNYEI